MTFLSRFHDLSRKKIRADGRVCLTRCKKHVFCAVYSAVSKQLRNCSSPNSILILTCYRLLGWGKGLVCICSDTNIDLKKKKNECQEKVPVLYLTELHFLLFSAGGKILGGLCTISGVIFITPLLPIIYNKFVRFQKLEDSKPLCQCR